MPRVSPICPFDPGRINANLVAPPHTAASIKRHLCKAEDVADYAYTRLFGDTSSSEPLDDGALVPILTGAGPGSTPSTPIALVVSSDIKTRSTASSPKTPNCECYIHNWSISNLLMFSNSGAPRNVLILVKPQHTPYAFNSTSE